METSSPMISTSVSRDDFPGLARLHRRVFGHWRTLESLIELFHWKYLLNPCGAANVAVARTGEGEIAGALASIPCRYQEGDQRHLYNLIVTFAVDPSLRRQGIFSRLFKAHAALVQERYDTPMIFGFPNRVSMQIGTARLGYRQLGMLSLLQVSLTRVGQVYRSPAGGRCEWLLDAGVRGVAKLISRRLRFPGAPREMGLESMRASEVSADWEEFHELFLSGIGRGIVRDRDWLRWRVFSEPSGNTMLFEVRRSSCLVGYFILEFCKGDVRVVDYGCVESGDMIDALVREMLAGASGIPGARRVLFPLIDKTLEPVLAPFRPVLIRTSPLVFCDFSSQGTLSPGVSGHGFEGNHYWLG